MGAVRSPLFCRLGGRFGQLHRFGQHQRAADQREHDLAERHQRRVRETNRRAVDEAEEGGNGATIMTSAALAGSKSNA
jgi:hypothetical protein